MAQIFDKIKVGNTSRSTFDLSHHQVTTSDFGYIIPICYRDMVPNDDFVVKPNIFCRLAPLAVPTYGRIVCKVNHFFVPYRLLYKEWNVFITGSNASYDTPPYTSVSEILKCLNRDPDFNPSTTSILERTHFTRLMSNLGLNPFLLSGLDPDERIALFPFLAYYRIWLDYYMDSSINNHEIKVRHFEEDFCPGGFLDEGDNLFLLFETRRCCYPKDYFTTARLDPQEGKSPSSVAVDVATDLNSSGFPPNSSNLNVRYTNLNSNVSIGASGSLADANSVIGQFTVEALRAATSLQRYLERNNYVGTKVINRLLAHFGVEPTPERLDMAEYLGGSSFPIQIGDVTSTNSVSSGDVVSAQGLGLQAGKGIGASQVESVRYHAKEHGVFMSLMTIVPETAYYQGISRFWQKGVTGDHLDFYMPEFENLGYQEILNKEVYVPYNRTIQGYQDYDQDGVFGYTPRFSEYKFQNDVLAGDFVNPSIEQSSQYSPNDSWHLFRHMVFNDDNPVALNNAFVECDNYSNDYDRIFQFTNNEFDHFYFNIDVDVKATRPMTGFTEPSLDNNNTAGDGNTVTLPYGGTRL